MKLKTLTLIATRGIIELAFLSKAEAESVFKEIKENVRSRQIESVSTSTILIDKLNKPSGSSKQGKSVVDSNKIEYGRKNNQIQQLGKEQVSGRERLASDGDGDSESSSKNRQGNRALKDSQGNQLSIKQAEYFANSKVRDKNGNLLVVYHGTENDFNVFKSSSGFNEFFFTDSIEARSLG